MTQGFSKTKVRHRDPVNPRRSKVSPEKAVSKTGSTLSVDKEHIINVLSLIEDSVITINAQQYITFFNQGAERLFGFTAQEILGKSLDTLIPARYADMHRQQVNKFSESSISARMMTTHGQIWGRRKDGTEFPAEASISKYGSGNNKIFAVVLRDISEQLMSQRVNERMVTVLETQQETIPDAILLVDENANIVSYNKKFIRMWDIPEELVEARVDEPVLQSVVEQMQDPDLFVARIRYLYDHRDEVSCDQLHTKDGRIIDRHSAPVVGPDGEYFGRVWYFRDVTAMFRADEALRRNQHILLEAQRIAHLGSWELDLVKNNLQWSDETFRIFELDPTEFGVSYEAFLDIIHPEDRDMVSKAYAESITNRTPYNIVHRLLMKDGRVKYVSEQCMTVYGDDGKALRSIGTVHDITQLMQEERAVKEREAQLRAFLNEIPAVIFMKDIEGRYVFANQGYQKAFSLTSEQVLSYTDAELYPAEQATKFLASDKRAMAGHTAIQVEEVVRHEDGDHTYLVSKFPIFNDDGKIINIGGVATDITERKLMETNLIRANRALRVLSTNSQSVIRSESECALMDEVCQLLIEIGGYRFAWIGFLEHSESKTIRPVSKAGNDAGYLEKSTLTWSGKGSDDYPTEISASTGIMQLCRDIAADSQMKPWQKMLLQRGFASVIALPLSGKSGIFAVLTIYSQEVNAFDDEERSLLQELADDLAFGISTHRTELKHQHAEKERRKLSSTVEQTADLVLITDRDGIIEYVNPAFERATGYSREEVLGKTPSILKSGQQDEHFYARMWETLQRGDAFLDVFINQRKDGTHYHEEKTITPLRDEWGHIINYVSSGRDITARIETEERLRIVAYHDKLTGLANRALLLKRLSQALFKTDRHQRLAAVLFIDIDRFKNVNDALGHGTGDKLLQEIANRLTCCVRQDDIVARFGGDEFTVILTDIACQQDIESILDKLFHELRLPVQLAGREFFITASIGISLYPDDSNDPETLLKNADVAMYFAKESGRDTFKYFSAELNVNIERRFALEAALRHAIDRKEFELYYQPQVDLISGGVMGVEALIRWHRDGEIVAPSEFIPVAEDTGLLLPIGEWVFRAACTQAVKWANEGLPHVKMSINLSARQFRDPNLIPTIQRILHETGVNPGWLEVEITESILMERPDLVLDIIQWLKSMGIGIALDDFGTGYSSLSYLNRFPIDLLKIDRSFVQTITTESNSATITQAIIGLAHSLGIKVIAEGVETSSQLEFLRSRGCHSIQGYYFSKPLQADELAQLLREDRRLKLHASEISDQQRTLLIVDDEENIRKTLIRTLRCEGYKILSASGPMEAYDLLAQHPVAVILSDQRMPEMNGVEFLKSVKNLYPTSVRIILSGYTDHESVTDAINRGAIYKFLTKPWDDDLLRENIREAFRQYTLGTMTSEEHVEMEVQV